MGGRVRAHRYDRILEEPSGMIVMKFGGTSVESAEAIRRVAAIVAQKAARKPLVVVSAMGKTTNRILAAAEQAASGNLADALNAVEELKDDTRREAVQAAGADRADAVAAILEREFGSLESAMEAIAERGELTPDAVSALKLHTTEVFSRVADACLQLFGGYGYMAEYPISRFWTDARVLRIYGGTSEIMKELVARSLLGR